MMTYVSREPLVSLVAGVLVLIIPRWLIARIFKGMDQVGQSRCSYGQRYGN
jgi:hypothetical protein